ncbi:threonine aldolase family protein [Algoriphagus limi]|uniref:Aminotransferase class I/II-fold pyridoxal phosphate-dependent enzyme n=1 Tax=Algoriphagus limi TaxID=2975273 RepID=A0ABT2G9P1_9BACT|nr:GntG family PLP-dependent aldolase [Algoriphagus limi]MCS5491924.1 aminotransferase class I/II-fold pyridoxal phosphate-dependent enzyme [Algoriphagus limi]
MLIDLRSDTVTRPTPGMKEAMFSAPVGDDVFGEDPTVNALEEKIAKLFGMEAALFCPSGTMTNQIAIRLHTQIQTEVICHKYSHIYLYEGGGIMANSLASVKLLDGDLGKITASQIAESINPDDVHAPETTMVSLENTMNKGGGSIYTLEEVKPIHRLCREKGLKLHLDGARLFNALVESGESPSDWGAHFDTISICLSKGLGCPVGSVLLGSKSDIKRARKVRKVFGGGMRQAGFLAAAGIYALDHHVDRLKEDHSRARALGEMLGELSVVSEILPVATNIVIARLEGITPEEFMKKLSDQNIKSVKFGKDLVRFVTHLDFEDEHLEEFGKRIENIK